MTLSPNRFLEKYLPAKWQPVYHLILKSVNLRPFLGRSLTPQAGLVILATVLQHTAHSLWTAVMAPQCTQP